MLNNQENSESNNQQPVIEDLAVNIDDASDVKGGPFVGGWGSSSYQYGFSGTYQP